MRTLAGSLVVVMMAVAGLLSLVPALGTAAPIALVPEGPTDGDVSLWFERALADRSAGALLVPGGWHIEVVDSEGEGGRYTSLALDGLGRPHIGYHDDTHGALKYAWHNGAGWQIETVDSDGDVGRSASLRLDGAGRPHIVYFDDDDPPVNHALKYARYDGLDWQIETVDSEKEMWGTAQLALDGSGQPHITYSDVTNYDLQYAWYDGTGWDIETVDGVGGRCASLALDASGRAHISYADVLNHNLKHAWRDGTGWQLETVDVCGSWGVDMVTETSLALDETGRPHISYSCSDTRYTFRVTPKYAWHDGTAWRIETLEDSMGSSSGHASLALDGAGRPHISYYDGYPNNDLKHFWYDGTSWQSETVDSDGNVGQHTSLALDILGRPRISYYDVSGQDLKYAWQDGATWRVYMPILMRDG